MSAELGHGSNVAGIETTAVYDPATQEFVINTPSESAQKCWIGGLAQTSHISVVFCQLTVGGVARGVHVLLVRIRNDDGSICKGVRVKDNGPKVYWGMRSFVQRQQQLLTICRWG